MYFVLPPLRDPARHTDILPSLRPLAGHTASSPCTPRQKYRPLHPPLDIQTLAPLPYILTLEPLPDVLPHLRRPNTDFVSVVKDKAAGAPVLEDSVVVLVLVELHAPVEPITERDTNQGT